MSLNNKRRNVRLLVPIIKNKKIKTDLKWSVCSSTLLHDIIPIQLFGWVPLPLKQSSGDIRTKDGMSTTTLQLPAPSTPTHTKDVITAVWLSTKGGYQTANIWAPTLLLPFVFLSPAFQGWGQFDLNSINPGSGFPSIFKYWKNVWPEKVVQSNLLTNKWSFDIHNVKWHFALIQLKGNSKLQHSHWFGYWVCFALQIICISLACLCLWSKETITAIASYLLSADACKIGQFRRALKRGETLCLDLLSRAKHSLALRRQAHFWIIGWYTLLKVIYSCAFISRKACIFHTNAKPQGKERQKAANIYILFPYIWFSQGFCPKLQHLPSLP